MLRENAPCAVLAALCLGLAALAAPAALAHSHKKRGLEIVHPWTSATSETGGRALVFMKIKMPPARVRNCCPLRRLPRPRWTCRKPPPTTPMRQPR